MQNVVVGAYITVLVKIEMEDHQKVAHTITYRVHAFAIRKEGRKYTRRRFELCFGSVMVHFVTAIVIQFILKDVHPFLDW